jgi:hypothetical protein
MAYGEYSGQCVGRLMYFLYKYSHHSDSWLFSENQTITSGHKGPVIASYTWDDDNDSDVPTFTFLEVPDRAYAWQEGSKQWVENMNHQQEHYKPMLLQDEKQDFEYRNRGKEYVPWSKKREELTTKLLAWNRKECLSAQIYNIPCSSVQTRKRYTVSGRMVDQHF